MFTKEELAQKLDVSRKIWHDIEHKTGVTQATMRNIVKDPETDRHRVVLIALTNYFKKLK